MEITKTPLADCLIIEAKKFGDDRGFFMESFNHKDFSEAGVNLEVKQINLAKSQKNVLRGLHYQVREFAQAKLVHVLQGSALDVVVDLRKESATYLQSFSIVLDDPSVFFYVPSGFAHGYYTLTNDTLFQYAVDNYYAPDHEAGIRYDDPKLNINWGLKGQPLISKKDLEHPLL